MLRNTTKANTFYHMSESSLAALPRLFDYKSDAEIAEMTFPSSGLFVSLSPRTVVRYNGSRKLPPGPPHSLSRDDDGSYSLTRVAIVRVHPDTHIQLARRMIRKAVLKSLAIGVMCGAVAAGGSIWYLRTKENAKSAVPANITAPCLVSAITNQGVGCQLGSQVVTVSTGKFFPDGQYQLQAITSDRRAFTAVRTTDQRPVIFQLDQHQSPQPQRGSNK